jgi:hypothetical protein
MRRWHWLTALAIGVGCIAAYAYYLTDSALPVRVDVPRPQEEPRRVEKKGDGDAEMSEPIEPIVVDRGPAGRTPVPEPPRADEPLPRVVLTPDTPQSPRPDADGKRTPRMPYADEETFFRMPLDPVTRMQQSTLPPLQLPDN